MLCIQRAESSDIPLIANLERLQYGTEAYPAMFFYQAFLQWPQLLFVAKDTSTALGSAQFLGYVLYAPAVDYETLWCMSLLTSRDARGKGVGRELMRFSLEQLSNTTQARNVELTVAPDNEAALSLYRKLGFEVINEATDLLGPGEARIQLRYIVPR